MYSPDSYKLLAVRIYTAYSECTRHSLEQTASKKHDGATRDERSNSRRVSSPRGKAGLKMRGAFGRRIMKRVLGSASDGRPRWLIKPINPGS